MLAVLWLVWVLVVLWSLYKAYRIPKGYRLGNSGLLIYNWLRIFGGSASYIRIYYDDIEDVIQGGGGVCCPSGCALSDRAHYADVTAPMVILVGVPMRSWYGAVKLRNVYLAPVHPVAFGDELRTRIDTWNALRGTLPHSPRGGSRHSRAAVAPARPTHPLVNGVFAHR
ncbi:uncharacterized protein AMSG_00299 [Thecamonas trahens ATCC 50062]|uniref:Uncharacterized protein n=1 Tax=Thecamonas trahens ATCC 50062 TaxID=461836 RepID=A0A0L0D237_THETB|nr:hypothetical protein AMSG_00299 [Thecamonas trahens ATCC 50062]KNC46180.1 hypothetical protein AMSG_00299 [Thecamonas trahens ATCC 50062]|eukprot:XP_013763155.1 hypothetical protein AMSG_00299 [Thecamonas trahens ATCC 50062]